MAYAEKGMLEEALAEIKKGLSLFPKGSSLQVDMGHVYALRGEREKTRAILDEIIESSKKEDVPYIYIASLYADLGEIDQAFEYLEKCYEKRDLSLSFIKIWPLSQLLRTDPRFIALLRKMRLET